MAEKPERIFVFDLDGTLADVTHRLHHLACKPKNWAKFFDECDKDKPIQWVIDLLEMVCFTRSDYDHVLILSGRSEHTRDKTEAWLHVHGITQYDELIMRKQGDFRPDETIKPELLQVFLDAHPNAEVAFIVDDRQRVVDMWRAKGYNVLQCNAWKETA